MKLSTKYLFHHHPHHHRTINLNNLNIKHNHNYNFDNLNNNHYFIFSPLGTTTTTNGSSTTSTSTNKTISTTTTNINNNNVNNNNRLPGRKRRPTNNTSSSTRQKASSFSSAGIQQHHHHGISMVGSAPTFTSDQILNGIGSSDVTMEECSAALLLMKLSAPPISPTLVPNNLEQSTARLYKCLWPGCKHPKVNDEQLIQQHVRVDHLQKQDNYNGDGNGEEDFYYTDEEDESEQPPIQGVFFTNATIHPHPHQSQFPTNQLHQLSSGPESPISFSETDAASSSSSSSHLMIAINGFSGDNSMDSSSNPPSPITTTMIAQQQQQPLQHYSLNGSTTFIPVQNPYRHLEDHEYNRRPDPAGISILGNGTGTVVPNNRRGRKSNNNNNQNNNSTTTTSNTMPQLIASHPINIPNMDQQHSQSLSSNSASFTSNGIGFHSAVSSLSSGFGSYASSFGSSFSPISPTRSQSGSLLSSSSSLVANNKFARITANSLIGSPLSSSQSSTSSPSHHNQQQQQQQNRTSPTKRVRGETKKCRKVYGMEKRDSWCTQCKWKKACSRFTD